MPPPSRPESGPRQPRPRRWARLIAIAVLPPLVLLGVLELLLASFGADRELPQRPASRGFDPQESYLVRGGPDGNSIATRVFDGGAHEVQIPDKAGRRRVVLFGESNVRVLPGPFLQQRLAALAPSQGYDVVNLGRPGYGSTRIRQLFEQAFLIEPDVVVIYIGHNEFVEEQFRSQWERAQDDWKTKTAEALRQLRTVDMAVSEFRRAAQEATPAAGADDFIAYFGDWTDAQQDALYDRYRANLSAMCAQALARGTKVILCTVPRNMLFPPVLSRSGLAPGSPEAEQSERLYRQALARIPARFATGILPHTVIMPFDWGLEVGEWWEEFYRPPAGGTLTETPLPQLAPGVLADVARLAQLWNQPPIADGALWTSPEGWSPRATRAVAGTGAIRTARLAAAERLELQAAAAELEQAALLAPRDAATRFLLAICRCLLGADSAEVVRLLDEAADRDRAPIHANGRINGIIRDVAAAHPGVVLLDADRAFRARANDGLIDYALIMDSNHLQPGARLLLLDDLAPLIVAD